ncbi:hypothetical protein GCM10010358_20120 [Streptomyces minutiscleroticus]|uniref:ATP-binding protein n=1 Tax=Streptomyces minutiscleroticus TaxID=68238 RepID=A0A918NGF6_9ACTN|nr:hypothetical protein [Streptomyces minutiscleroticus]GGX65698.1 hypothetical protein GCM10010358_20120 [Streptomyces minutiscleroticus]
MVKLLVSELVTNAYRHTRGLASLRLTAPAGGRYGRNVTESVSR